MHDILKRIESDPMITLTREELDIFLDQCDLIEDHDTFICDRIRLLNCGGTILVQETTDKDEILAHRFDTLEKARAFIRNRMETYERMWDGCGCRIFYHDTQ